MIYRANWLLSQSFRFEVVVTLFLLVCCRCATAESFSFLNITDLPGGPGEGRLPSINDQQDIAFQKDANIFFHDRSTSTFLDVTGLPGAPAGARFPKLNNQGNIAMIESVTDDLWLFEAASQTFTNVSSLANYPGNSGSFNLAGGFDLNDNNKISFHSGDKNIGTVHLYDHASASFVEVTNQVGGSFRGRENVINNADQVGYMGFPSLLVHDLATSGTTNLSNLPGGPGGVSDNFVLNDLGDVAIFTPNDVVFFDASASSFLSLASLPDWPAGSASSSPNDLSDNGGITFWRTEIYFFDPIDQSFTQLTDQLGATPAGGHGSSINDSGQIAFAAGLFGIEDIFLAIPFSGRLSADFDEDGEVEGSDFLTWQKGFGTASGALHADGDADADGAVNRNDLLVWQTQFGSAAGATASSPGVMAVPEPSALVLLFVMGLCWPGTCRCPRNPVRGPNHPRRRVAPLVPRPATARSGAGSFRSPRSAADRPTAPA